MPSLSKSRKATPVPVVSRMYLLVAVPPKTVRCVRPALEATSTKVGDGPGAPTITAPATLKTAANLSTTEDTEDTENQSYFVIRSYLCVLRVLRGGELRSSEREPSSNPEHARTEDVGRLAEIRAAVRI